MPSKIIKCSDISWLNRPVQLSGNPTRQPHLKTSASTQGHQADTDKLGLESINYLKGHDKQATY